MLCLYCGHVGITHLFICMSVVPPLQYVLMFAGAPLSLLSFVLNRIFLTLLSCFLTLAVRSSAAVNNVSVYMQADQSIKFPGELVVREYVDF